MLDWQTLAKKVGSIKRKQEVGSSEYVQQALEEIIGTIEIKKTVDYILKFPPGSFKGSELALNVLMYLRSKSAVEYLLEKYKQAKGQYKIDIVWLISKIAHPISFSYIKVFLADKDLCGWGINLLDQLIYQDKISSEEAESLLFLAERHVNTLVKDQAKFIREYLRKRNFQSHLD